MCDPEGKTSTIKFHSWHKVHCPIGTLCDCGKIAKIEDPTRELYKVIVYINDQNQRKHDLIMTL